MLSIGAMADIFRCHPESIRRLIKKGTLPSPPASKPIRRHILDPAGRTYRMRLWPVEDIAALYEMAQETGWFENRWKTGPFKAAWAEWLWKRNGGATGLRP
jgi:hypothetical protein